MPRNPTLFTVEIPITKKMMDLAIAANAYQLEDYDPQHYRAAGLNPNRIRRELANDEWFRAELGRQIQTTVRNELKDYIIVIAGTPAVLKDAIKRLERAVKAEEEEEERGLMAQRIEEAAELLRKQGYRVAKA